MAMADRPVSWRHSVPRSGRLAAANYTTAARPGPLRGNSLHCAADLSNHPDISVRAYRSFFAEPINGVGGVMVPGPNIFPPLMIVQSMTAYSSPMRFKQASGARGGSSWESSSGEFGPTS